MPQDDIIRLRGHLYPDIVDFAKSRINIDIGKATGRKLSSEWEDKMYNSRISQFIINENVDKSLLYAEIAKEVERQQSIEPTSPHSSSLVEEKDFWLVATMPEGQS